MVGFEDIHYRPSGRWVSCVCCGEFGLKLLLPVLVSVLVLLGLFQASPSFSQSSPVVANEIFYDLSVPADKPPECTTVNYFEWLELKNISSQDVYLSNWVLQDNKLQDSLSGVLEPGKLLVIAARESCFRALYPNFSGNLLNLDNYIGNGLGNDGDVVILLEEGIERDRKEYQAGAASKDMSFARDIDGNWKEANPTPGVENSFPEEGTKDQQQEEEQPQPAIIFSSPSTVSVGTPFFVSITLNNFKSGTYSLKVLIGEGDKFYDGRTKGVNGEWLAWNAGWVDFPKVSVGSSGSGSGTVQAKTDDDVTAGSYLIKVRAYDGKNTFDSDTKSLAVAGSAKPAGTLGATGSEELGSDNAEEILGEVTGGGGEVKGGETPRGEGFKLNFYTILGIFGLLVGSGGLTLAFRRGAQRSQTPDTPEQESTPLSERSCTPNG